MVQRIVKYTSSAKQYTIIYTVDSFSAVHLQCRIVFCCNGECGATTVRSIYKLAIVIMETSGMTRHGGTRNNHCDISHIWVMLGDETPCAAMIILTHM